MPVGAVPPATVTSSVKLDPAVPDEGGVSVRLGVVLSVQVLTLEVLFAGFGSCSLPVTVAVLVTHVLPAAGAFPVTVKVSVTPTFSSPSSQVTAPPATLHPAEVLATPVTPAGTASFTTKPELIPAPWLVTFSVQVILPEAATVAGPVFTIPRSTGVGTQAAPSSEAFVFGPV